LGSDQDGEKAGRWADLGSKFSPRLRAKIMIKDIPHNQFTPF
jgi:hypothetical protein